MNLANARLVAITDLDAFRIAAAAQESQKRGHPVEIAEMSVS
jgi:hypothetical protein